MKIDKKQKKDIPFGPKTLRVAAEEAQKEKSHVLACAQGAVYPGTEEINMSSVQTQLIQLAGRFCEHYASDLICTLEELDAFHEGVPEPQDTTWVIGVGLHECGVDSTTSIMNVLGEEVAWKQPAKVRDCEGEFMLVRSPSKYRKMLAILIKEEKTEHSWTKLSIVLVDITRSLHKVFKEDF